MDKALPYDVVIIGGGHAGIEAAWAAASGCGGRDTRVALVTLDPAKIGVMSCNPAIGGLAKGQMVREIDALGGLMGLVSDATGIQFKVLNRSKGPAVRGPRCQSDKYAYRDEAQRLIAMRQNIDVYAGACENLIVEDGRCVGVFCKSALQDHGLAIETDACCGEFGAICNTDKSFALKAKAVVLTTGTFMRGLMHTGEEKKEGGRVGEGAAVGISAELRRLGFELGRLKTGTPPRLDGTTIDLKSLEEQWGDETPDPFSELSAHGDLKSPIYSGIRERFPVIEQVCCWATHTNQTVHEAILANLARAPMYNGQIDSGGPRYCPSIEDKVVRFADRSSHHVFLEPESLRTDEVYCNGISTSLPKDIQDIIVRSLPGCEKAKIIRYGYAVEYDSVMPHQIDATTMTKTVPGLFLAGQINGTSGYEEAAGQGLLAGLNAIRYGRDQDLVRFTRDQAYIGVLMDDLVTKTPKEPYRMFTSRAEHRLLLRSDNAAERLTPLGRELGLVDDERWAIYQAKQAEEAELEEIIACEKVDGVPMAKWLLRPEVTDAQVTERTGHDGETLFRVLARVRYAPHIERHGREMAKLREQEQHALPMAYDYAQVPGLRTEAVLTLNKFKPATLGQAGRLAGVNPADLMLVSVAVRKLATA